MTEDKKKAEDNIVEAVKNKTTEQNNNQNDTTNDHKVDKKEEGEKVTEKKVFEKKPFKKNFRKTRKPFKREKPEFEQKILSLRRVTRVMAGGRRFSFSVAMVIGDKKGRVGVGLGKANDTTSAIQKAVRNAKKNMVKVKLTENGSVLFDVNAKYKASKVSIRPVTGKGLAAGGAVRTVLEFAGAKEAGAKILSRSKNHLNNAKATIIALAPFSEKIEVLENNKKKLFKKKPLFKKPFRKDDVKEIKK